MSDIVATFDLSTSTGWAWREAREFAPHYVEIEVKSGAATFTVGVGQSPDLRFLRFRTWLLTHLERARPDLVYYELPHLRGFDSTVLLCGLVAILRETCAARGIEVRGVHSGTLKRIAAGSGKADKVAVVRAMREKWPGWTPATDDEADARALLLVHDAVVRGELSVVRGKVKPPSKGRTKR